MKRWLIALVLACAALSVPGVMSSGADFTAASSNPANVVTSAASFNTIAVTMTDPGTPLHGTVTLASASSSNYGITRVAYEYQLNGSSTWTPACSSTSSPFSCSWNTTAVPNGTYALRATATDGTGRTRTSAIVASRVLDNLGPVVSLADPGVLTGTESLTVTATDAGAGVGSVSISYRRAGTSTWTQLCSGTTSPKTCSFDTTAQPDGDVELMASAVDNATNSRDTAVITRRVDNHAPVVTTTDPGSIRGLSTLAATVDDGAGTGVVSVTVQARPNGTTAWIDVCTDTSAPYTCSYDTSTSPDGLYDLRATAIDGAGLTGTSTALTRRVDNTAPVVPTLTDPGTMSGTKALTGTGSDAGSGLATWTVQYRVATTGTWTDACTDTTSPFGSCSWNTATVADGLYDLRVVATDVAGNSATSLTTASRRVDNLGPAVTMTDPGPYLRGIKTLSATASDGVGVQSVAIQRKATSGSTWTTICTDTTSSYSCSLTTTTLADGLYDFRAVATDTLGHQSTSASVTSRAIDNTAPTATGIQTTNGGSIKGRPEANDSIVFTYSEQVAPATILAGWTGPSTAVRVNFVDGGTRDTVTLSNSAGTAALGLTSTAGITTNQDFTDANVSFDATMVQSGATITITLTAKRGTTAVKTSTRTGTLSYTPVSTITDPAGNALTVTTVTESGTADVDF